jgi:hypothetical protein
MSEKQTQPTEQPTEQQNDNFLVWDKLFSILAWKFIPTKSGDMMINAEDVYNELKDEFNLTFNTKER